jgi:hypothetical protein
VRGLKSKCRCCWQKSCKEGKCGVSLPRRKNLCINGTSYQANHKYRSPLCDCIVFWQPSGATLVGAIELKGGAVHASTVIEQLQGGATIADQLLESGERIRLFPILASRMLNTNEHRILRRTRIKIRGESELIILVKCGQSFEDIVHEYDNA